MATSAPAITDRQLEERLRQLQSDTAGTNKKLGDDQRKLETANAERLQLMERIKSGLSSDILQKVKSEIETLEIRIDGHRAALATNQAQIEQAKKEFDERRQTAILASRQKQFAALIEKGNALALGIREKLAKLCVEDLCALEELRAQLLMEYPDLDARQATNAFRRMLYNPPRNSEHLRVPEVHWAQLEAAGFVPFGIEAAEHRAGQLTVAPAPPLFLQVVAMRQKGK